MRSLNDGQKSQVPPFIDGSVEKMANSYINLIVQLENRGYDASTMVSGIVATDEECISLDAEIEACWVLIIKKIERNLPDLVPAIQNIRQLIDTRQENTEAIGDMMVADALTMREINLDTKYGEN